MNNIETNIINKLIKIGLNKYEAMVYITLLKNPQITAYEIGKRSGVPQSKIYETVKGLTNQCIITLITSTGESTPSKYIAIPLEEFLDNYKKETENTINYIKENVKDINNTECVEYIWHFYGKDKTTNKVRTMIENAQKSIYLDIWAEDYEIVYDDLLKAHNKGVEIITVIYGDIKNELGTVYYHEMNGMEKDASINGKWLSLVVDYSECLFGILKDEDSCAVWSQNKSFMLVTECFITHDIFISEIYSKFKPLLDKEFGCNLENIRKKLHIG